MMHLAVGAIFLIIGAIIVLISCRMYIKGYKTTNNSITLSKEWERGDDMMAFSIPLVLIGMVIFFIGCGLL